MVEILRVAAGDGRLTEAELDERLGAALTARTSGELAALTADLPEVAGQAGGSAARAKDVVRLDYQGGNTTRRGRWMVPQRMEIRAVGGTVKLDFTDAVITSPTLQIQAEVRGGRLVLVTKPGIEVDADDVAVHGGGVKVWPEHGWDAPVKLKMMYWARPAAATWSRGRRAGRSGSGCCAGQGRTSGQLGADAAAKRRIR